MLRVAVRRFRPETIGIVAGLASVGLLALVTGRSMNSDYHSSGLADCLAGGSASQCRDLVERFGERFNVAPGPHRAAGVAPGACSGPSSALHWSPVNWRPERIASSGRKA